METVSFPYQIQAFGVRYKIKTIGMSRAILIGSQAWIASTKGSSFRQPEDSDMIMDFGDFEDFVTANKSQIQTIKQVRAYAEPVCGLVGQKTPF